MDRMPAASSNKVTDSAVCNRERLSCHTQFPPSYRQKLWPPGYIQTQTEIAKAAKAGWLSFNSDSRGQTLPTPPRLQKPSRFSKDSRSVIQYVTEVGSSQRTASSAVIDPSLLHGLENATLLLFPLVPPFSVLIHSSKHWCMPTATATSGRPRGISGQTGNTDLLRKREHGGFPAQCYRSQSSKERSEGHI